MIKDNSQRPKLSQVNVRGEFQEAELALVACDDAIDHCAAQLRIPAVALRRYLGRWALVEDLDAAADFTFRATSNCT